jgi:hypothetical protein
MNYGNLGSSLAMMTLRQQVSYYECFKKKTLNEDFCTTHIYPYTKMLMALEYIQLYRGCLCEGFEPDVTSVPTGCSNHYAESLFMYSTLVEAYDKFYLYFIDVHKCKQMCVCFFFFFNRICRSNEGCGCLSLKRKKHMQHITDSIALYRVTQKVSYPYFIW